MRKRTGKGSILLRMIDVVFILIFGFVGVSQVSQAENVELPGSQEAALPAPEGPGVLVITMTSNTEYAVENGDKVFADLGSLRAHIEQVGRASAENAGTLRIRIRANYDVSIASAMRVAILCRNLGYAKGIDVVRVNERPE